LAVYECDIFLSGCSKSNCNIIIPLLSNPLLQDHPYSLTVASSTSSIKQPV